jgi:hypothetical protein
MPCSRAARAMTGAAPVPVPPPMPAAMKTMCAPWIESMTWARISSSWRRFFARLLRADLGTRIAARAEDP